MLENKIQQYWIHNWKRLSSENLFIF